MKRAGIFEKSGNIWDHVKRNGRIEKNILVWIVERVVDILNRGIKQNNKIENVNSIEIYKKWEIFGPLNRIIIQ